MSPWGCEQSCHLPCWNSLLGIACRVRQPQFLWLRPEGSRGEGQERYPVCRKELVCVSAEGHKGWREVAEGEQLERQVRTWRKPSCICHNPKGCRAEANGRDRCRHGTTGTRTIACPCDNRGKGAEMWADLHVIRKQNKLDFQPGHRPVSGRLCLSGEL